MLVNEALMIPLLALTIPLVVAPLAILTKHRQRRREWQHAERMRALELGHPLPAATGQAWPALVAIFIGAGVPVGTFLISWLATASTSHVVEQVFMGASVVSLAAVIAGYRLGSRLIAASPTPQESVAARSNGKPVLDPDAYDVVGRRG